MYFTRKAQDKWAEVLRCGSRGFIFFTSLLWKSLLDAEHKRWVCWTLFRLRLKVSLDANQLLLGVFRVAIHQANVPLNQQLMSQTHTVCSFTMGHFTAVTGWRKWEKMMRKKKNLERDWKENKIRGKLQRRWYLSSCTVDATEKRKEKHKLWCSAFKPVVTKTALPV